MIGQLQKKTNFKNRIWDTRLFFIKKSLAFSKDLFTYFNIKKPLYCKSFSTIDKKCVALKEKCLQINIIHSVFFYFQMIWWYLSKWWTCWSYQVVVGEKIWKLNLLKENYDRLCCKGWDDCFVKQCLWVIGFSILNGGYSTINKV